MHKEIGKAVDIFHRIALGTKNGSKLCEKKLAAFVAILTELLTVRYEKNWYPENPDRGSGYRCIRVNGQSIDPTIKEGLKRANIAVPKTLLRTELTIWVDPGVVSVRIGEDGSIGSEVVDEDICNLNRKGKEQSDKQSGLESDEGFISRSPSPDSSASDRSASVSPVIVRSLTPSKPASSSTPSTMEYNPYSPPSSLSYPHRFQQPSPPHTPAQQPPKSMTPSANLMSSAVRSQGRPMLPHGPRPTVVSSPQGDIFGQGHIPVSNLQRTQYTRPRTLFPSQENTSSRSALEGFGKMAFNPFAMPMNYGGNIPQANYYDIPTMA